ncbi:MAG: hypothetical protein HN348_04085 [Proteobacteria bacterium]|jgi:hypothetical protein|nr:hypothetical protein [Pseudomonadota bacterium]
MMLIGLFLLIGEAMSANLPQIVVVGIHDKELDADDQRRAVRDLGRAIENSKKAHAIAGDDFVRLISRREDFILRNAFVAPGLRLLADGRLLYNQAQAQEAIDVFYQSIEVMGDAMAVVDARDDLWETWVYLGTAHYSIDEEGDCRRAFSAAVAVNDKRDLDPSRFPPYLVELYSTVRDESRERGALIELIAPDDRASVYLNGELKGHTDFTIVDVLPGPNYITARGITGLRQFLKVDVPPSAALNFTLYPKTPVLAQPAEGPLDRSQQIAHLYRALGQQTKGALVLMVGVDDSLLHLQLYEPGSDTFSPSMTIPYSGKPDDEAAQTVPLVLNLLEDGVLPDNANDIQAIPLDISANVLLTGVLLNPVDVYDLAIKTSKEPTPRERGKLKPWVIGVISASAAATVGATTAIVLTQTGRTPVQPDPHRGTIVVGPFED